MDSSIAQLVSMGFDTSQAQYALEVSNGSLDRAVDYLLGGGSGGDGDFASSMPTTTSNDYSNDNNNSSNDIEMISCDINQYSRKNGRSACTCIALTGAKDFLQQISPPSEESSSRRAVGDIVTLEFLRTMVIDGIKTYNQLNQSISTGGVEHMSTEEVINNDKLSSSSVFSSLTLVGGIRQGVLSTNSSSGGDNPLGFRSLIEGIRSDIQSTTKWVAVLITKTPETIVVCLPPINSGSDGRYIILDSHPRAQQFGSQGENAYARIHSNLNDFIVSLESIFPAVDLGGGGGENDMMAMMYNSFDLYPFILS